MKLLAVSSAVTLLVLALYASSAADAALAYSPDNRSLPTVEPFIDEDEGFYDGPVERADGELAHSFLAGPQGGVPPAHQTKSGVNPDDLEFLEQLHLGPAEFRESYLADGSPDTDLAPVNAKVTSDILGLPWVTDGLTDRERVGAAWLSVLDDFSPEAASKIVRMPFLRTFGPADVEAIRSLTAIAYDDDRYDRDVLLSVLDNPNIADGGGIDDQEAKIVAVLGGTNRVNPKLVDVLLDPTQTSIEERRISASDGEVNLAIIRTAPGAADTIALLEYAVREATVMMGQSFPTDYVALLVEEATVGDSIGTNFQTHMAITPEFDVDDRSSRPGNYTGQLIAHEVAHYYWFGLIDWIDEGAADFMAISNENRRVGQPMEVDNPPCPYYETLFHLERSNPRQGTWGGQCNYALGERLFLDLHSALGDVRFYQGFRNLRRLTQADNADETAPVNHLSAAFQAAALTPDQKAILNFVLARRYGSIILTDTSPVDPKIPELAGTVDGVWLARYVNREVAEIHAGFTSISASRISDYWYLRLSVSYDRELLADHELEFEIVEYYEDGFVFDRSTYTVPFPAGYMGARLRFCCMGFIPDYRWPTGLYWTYVYHEGRKIAELHYEVTP